MSSDKKRSTVYIPEDLHERAKNEKINMSKTLERALKLKLNENNGGFNYSNEYQNNQLLRGSPSQVNGAALRARPEFEKEDLEAFLSRLEASGRSKVRIKTLKSKLNRWLDAVSWSPTLTKTTDFINRRKEEVSKKTLSDDVQAIKQFLKNQDVPWGSKIESVNPPRKRPRVVDREDVLDFIDFLKNTPMRANKYNYRAKTAVVLSAVSGMRPYEVYRLEWDDINIEERYIDLPAEKTKTKEERFVIFNEEARDHLEQLREHFPKSENAFHKKMIRYLISKREKEPPIKFKHCRKFFSQEWDRAQMPTSTKEILLGHFGSIDASNYNNQRVEDLRGVYDDVDIELFR
jgi:integrase/recombinase XerD